MPDPKFSLDEDARLEKNEFRKLDAAAVLALARYLEQELYRASGIKLRVTSQNFTGAMENILYKDGLNDKDIKRASDDGARLARQKNAGNVAGEEGGNGEGAWGTRPLEIGARDQFPSE